jgi:hypothetical protein
MKYALIVLFSTLLLSSCSTMDRWMGGGSSSSSGMGANSDTSSMSSDSNSYGGGMRGASRGMGGGSDRTVGGAIANPATNPVLSSDPRNIYFGN